jgi:hypothetical protein
MTAKVRIYSILAPDQLQALGQITANFTILEDFLKSLITDLIGYDSTIAKIITCELSFRKLVDLLATISAYRIADEEKLKTMKQIISRAGEVENKRNTVVHSGWTFGRSAGSVTRIKTTAKRKHGLRSHEEPMETATLYAIADEIAELSGDIVKFHEAL